RLRVAAPIAEQVADARQRDGNDDQQREDEHGFVCGRAGGECSGDVVAPSRMSSFGARREPSRAQFDASIDRTISCTRAVLPMESRTCCSPPPWSAAIRSPTG